MGYVLNSGHRRKPAMPRSTPPVATVGAIAQDGRRDWTVKRARRGGRHELIAGNDALTPARIGPIVRGTPARRDVAPAGGRTRRLTARRDAARRRAAGRPEVHEGAGIDRRRRGRGRLDRIRTEAGALKPFDRDADDGMRRSADESARLAGLAAEPEAAGRSANGIDRPRYDDAARARPPARRPRTAPHPPKSG
jgi:hypothetical protein